jgi:hypothetical protein
VRHGTATDRRRRGSQEYRSPIKPGRGDQASRPQSVDLHQSSPDRVGETHAGCIDAGARTARQPIPGHPPIHRAEIRQPCRQAPGLPRRGAGRRNVSRPDAYDIGGMSAGSMPFRFEILATLQSDRTWPHVGFARASRTTNCWTCRVMGGRPGFADLGRSSPTCGRGEAGVSGCVNRIRRIPNSSRGTVCSARG